MNAPPLNPADLEPVTVVMPDELDVATAPGARSSLMAALGKGSAVVIADLTRTRFCGGAGADLLADTHLEAIVIGAELRVAASAPVRKILALTNLDGELAVYPTLSAALAGHVTGVA